MCRLHQHDPSCRPGSEPGLGSRPELAPDPSEGEELGHEPDFDSLRGTSTRIVVAGGAEPEDTFPYRAALAVADKIGTKVAVFPSHHGGFHEQGDPDSFAATLRHVLNNGRDR